MAHHMATKGTSHSDSKANLVLISLDRLCKISRPTTSLHTTRTSTHLATTKASSTHSPASRTVRIAVATAEITSMVQIDGCQDLLQAPLLVQVEVEEEPHQHSSPTFHGLQRLAHEVVVPRQKRRAHSQPPHKQRRRQSMRMITPSVLRRTSA